MKLGDVDQVVSIHLASFSRFFLSFLGPRFLKLYYSCNCSVNESISLVCSNSHGKITGFIVGSSNPRDFYSILLRRYWLKFAFLSVNAAIKKPFVIKRIARAVFHPSNNPVGDNIAGLYSIGVLPEIQRTGIAKKLIRAFLEEAGKRGCDKVFLTTDRDNNEVVNNFYQQLGFHIDRQYVTPEGRRMNEYWIDLRADDSNLECREGYEQQ